MTSAVKRHLYEVEGIALDLVEMLDNLKPWQQIDVLTWALYGRDCRAATGIPVYAPTAPLELPNSYIQRQYVFAENRGPNSE